MKRLPVNTSPAFVAQHQDQARKMLKFMTTKRGRVAVDDITAETFKATAAVSLKAMSAQGRIGFGKSAKKAFAAYHENIGKAEFLSLCPRQFAVAMRDAAAFDINRLIGWGQQQLEGSHYVAVVDLAYYSNIPTDLDQPQTAHFHLHAIRWMSPKQQYDLHDHFEPVGQSELPLVAGLQACHARPLRPQKVAGQALYMCKMPLNEYRVYRRMAEEVDPVTGEILKVPTKRYIQRKRPLRPGAVAKIMRVFGDRDIPSLAFAGGDGVPLLDGILRRARRYAERHPRLPDDDQTSED